MSSIGKIIELKENESVALDYLTSRGVNLESLSTYLQKIEPFLAKVGGTYEVRESSPTLDTLLKRFNPGRWVGRYVLGAGNPDLLVKSSKITEDEFNSIAEEISGWIQIRSTPFFDSFLSVFTTQLLDDTAIWTVYSALLLELTESLSGLRKPRVMIVRERVGEDFFGRPNWNKTFQLQITDPSLYASTKIDFSFKTALNLLFVRFHAELAKRISNDIANLRARKELLLGEFISEALSKCQSHLEFLDSDPYRNLFDDAVEFDPFDPVTMHQLDTEAAQHREMQSLIDLWEAYNRRLSLHLDPAQRFRISLKPIGKIYELWILKKVIELMGDPEITNGQYRPPRAFPWTFEFRGNRHLKLYYNGGSKLDSLDNHSQVLGNLSTAYQRFLEQTYPSLMDKFALAKLRPGFAFVNADTNQVIALADTRYQTLDELGRDSTIWERSLSYVEEFTPKSLKEQGKSVPFFIFYLGPETKIVPLISSNISVWLIPLRPNIVKDPAMQKELLSVIGDLLRH